jgi:hypothetical protein
MAMSMPRCRACSKLSLLALAVGLVACSVPVAYQPDEGVLEGMRSDQREQLFAETLSRALKPRIAQVWIDDSSYGYDGAVAVRDGFGIPIGYGARRRIVYFGNVRELRLYDNNAVFVFDVSGRLVDKLQFGYREDAQRMIDLIAAYRARRYAGAAAADTDHRARHRYDRRYEPRPMPPPPPYDPRFGPPDPRFGPPDRYDDDERYDEHGYDGPR